KKLERKSRRVRSKNVLYVHSQASIPQSGWSDANGCGGEFQVSGYRFQVEEEARLETCNSKPDTSPMPAIDLIVPARDEEANIPALLAALPTDLLRRVIVVDNGSSDRTAELARHG